MNPEEIVAHLRAKGFEACFEGDGQSLTVTFKAGEHQLKLWHQFPDAIRQLPKFYLLAAETYGTLAHVTLITSGHGSVCVQDRESISVNFEVPALAYEESLKRHINLIEKLILNPEWNRLELLREFYSNWEILCTLTGILNLKLYCAGDSKIPYSLYIKRPKRKTKVGIQGHFLGQDQKQSNNLAFKTIRRSLHWDSRQASGRAIVLALSSLEPAPVSLNDLALWYIDALTKLCPDSMAKLKHFQKHPSKEFWLVFCANTVSGDTWFSIRFRSKVKAKLPITINQCQPWTIEPFIVRSLSRESLMPRSGGRSELAERSVLLVGCGSVGSEVAHRLASAGVGKLVISDPDLFSADNLYRHTLSIGDIGYHKSPCVAMDLCLKYPWIIAEGVCKNLETFSEIEELDQFDLIIVAIGSPTIEREFHAFVESNGVITAVVNTWVEAHGVGGHATLDIPSTKGCLRCAYVDPRELSRGLSSNLNFLKPNQELTITHAGCGNQFLPYSGIAASYTATIAADLATQYLMSTIANSSKISWKGNADEAVRQGFKLTHRYENFSKPLEVLPLFNSECDVCSD